MTRVEFTVTGEGGRCLREPGLFEHGADLPVLIMRAVEDFLEAHGGQLVLPITIHARPGPAAATPQTIGA